MVPFDHINTWNYFTYCILLKSHFFLTKYDVGLADSQNTCVLMVQLKKLHIHLYHVKSEKSYYKSLVGRSYTLSWRSIFILSPKWPDIGLSQECPSIPCPIIHKKGQAPGHVLDMSSTHPGGIHDKCCQLELIWGHRTQGVDMIYDMTRTWEECILMIMGYLDHTTCYSGHKEHIYIHQY